MLWENEVFDSDSTDAAIVVSDSAIRAYFCHHRRLTANAIIRHPGPFSRTNGILLAAPVQVNVHEPWTRLQRRPWRELLSKQALIFCSAAAGSLSPHPSNSSVKAEAISPVPLPFL